MQPVRNWHQDCYCKLQSLENFIVLRTCIYCCVVQNRNCFLMSLPNKEKRKQFSWFTIPACNSSLGTFWYPVVYVLVISEIQCTYVATRFAFFFSGFKSWVQYISQRNFNLNISISCTVCKIVRCVVHELCCNLRWTEAMLLNVLTSILSSLFFFPCAWICVPFGSPS